MGPQSVLFPIAPSYLRRAALLTLFIAAPLLAQTKAPASPSVPQVAVVINLRSSELTVIDAKYRVFYNKFEKKTLPIQGYDLRSAIQDEVMTRLAEDKRFQWRMASDDDQLDPVKLADEKHRTAEMVSTPKADRVLLVDVWGFGAWVTALAADRMDAGFDFVMLDRATGRKLWKHRIVERIKFSGDLQKLQADNQKELKEGVNKLIENVCQKMKTKIAQIGRASCRERVYVLV